MSFDKVYIKEVLEEKVIKDKYVQVTFTGKYYGKIEKFKTIYSISVWEHDKKVGYTFVDFGPKF